MKKIGEDEKHKTFTNGYLEIWKLINLEINKHNYIYSKIEIKRGESLYSFLEKRLERGLLPSAAYFLL